jgi:TetR/AcrR family transcriptional regulator
MPPRRLGTENSPTRAVLIKAAAKVLREQGYAAVTALAVATEARLKPQLVHYYFRTMDDLLLAVLRYGAEERLRRLAEAVSSDQPLRALWEMNRDASSTALQMEFAASANHRPVIRAEVRRFAKKYRNIQAAALARHFELRGISVPVQPVVLTVLMLGLSQILVREETTGMTVGHAETEAFIEEWLRRLPKGQKKPAATSTGKKPSAVRPVLAQSRPRTRENASDTAKTTRPTRAAAIPRSARR